MPNRRTVIATAALGFGMGLAAPSISTFAWRTSNGVALDDRDLVILDAAGPSILVVNPFEERLIASFPVTGDPTGLARSTEAGFAVAVDAVAKTLDTVAAGSDVAITRTAVDIEPSLVASAPDGKTLAVADWGHGVLLLLDAGTGAELARFSGYEGAHGLVFDAAGATLYVPIIDAPQIHRIDLVERVEREPLGVPGVIGVERLAPPGERRWALALPPASEGSRVYWVDLTGAEPPTSWNATYPVGRAVAYAEGDRYLAASSWEPDVLVLSRDAGVLRRQTLGAELFDALALGPGERVGIAISVEAETAVVFDADDLRPLATLALPSAPAAMAVHGWSGKAFVSLPDAQAIGVIDLFPRPAQATGLRLIETPNAAPFAIPSPENAGLCHP